MFSGVFAFYASAGDQRRMEVYIPVRRAMKRIGSFVDQGVFGG
jgi:hypothetical protein